MLLCLATAVAYAEISKLYPGTGSSYYYAEQAMLSKDKAFKYARIAKFIVGWGSHLYYWVYPGVMVATTGIFVGYVVGFLYPNFMSGSNPGPVFMALVAIVFSFFVAWIAQKGAGASTAVNLAINVDPDLRAASSSACWRSAIAPIIPPELGRPRSSTTAQSLATYTYQFATNPKDGSIIRDASGVPQPLLDAAGKPVPFTIDYPDDGRQRQHPDAPRNAASVVGVHKFSWVFIQATVAILILVGFRIGDRDGRRGQEPNQAHSHRGDCIAADPGAVLLPVRVFCRQLLPELGVHDAERGRLGGAHRRHDDHRRRCAARARVTASTSCWPKRSPCSWPSSAPRCAA